MITNDNQNYNRYEGNLPQENQNSIGDNTLEQQLNLSENQNNYPDEEFSNALEGDNDFDEDNLDEDLEEDLDEDLNEEDIDDDDLDNDLAEEDEKVQEPETFADDKYKID